MLDTPRELIVVTLPFYGMVVVYLQANSLNLLRKLNAFAKHRHKTYKFKISKEHNFTKQELSDAENVISVTNSMHNKASITDAVQFGLFLSALLYFDFKYYHIVILTVAVALIIVKQVYCFKMNKSEAQAIHEVFEHNEKTA